MFNFPLPQDEEPLLIIKAHWSSYLSGFLKVVFAVTVPAVAVTLIRDFWWREKWGQAAVVILVFGALIYLLISFWKKFLTTYIITRCRLIDITQSGVLKREITEITLDEIEEARAIMRGLASKIFCTGRAAVKLKNGRGVVIFYDIKNPETVKEILEEVEKRVANIVGKRGRECNVVLKDNTVKKVPLSYSYYGERAERLGRKNGDLVIKEKKRRI